ncbi:DUF6009 family protein [Streptomyces sp. NBC_01207]|uniref:DUF6009 family protein n=1 Tax=Streptomyces sp. NBC_01207 TaxID=2903772 RepID=UPI003FA3A6C1
MPPRLRGRPPGIPQGHADAAAGDGGTFRRRVVWLLPHDRNTVPDGLYASGAPAEAVDPTTLTARSKGRKSRTRAHLGGQLIAHQGQRVLDGGGRICPVQKFVEW